MTARDPPKSPLLMAFTITIIRRAISLRRVSTAYLLQSPALSSPWQSVQFNDSDAAKKPMVSMNSFTGIPRNTWMFLNASSDISGFCAVLGDCVELGDCAVPSERV